MVSIRHRELDFSRVPARFFEPVFNDDYGSFVEIFVREARREVEKVFCERIQES